MEYISVAVVAGLLVVGWMLRRWLTPEAQQDPRVLLVIIAALSFSIIAAVVVGSVLR